MKITSHPYLVVGIGVLVENPTVTLNRVLRLKGLVVYNTITVPVSSYSSPPPLLRTVNTGTVVGIVVPDK